MIFGSTASLPPSLATPALRERRIMHAKSSQPTGIGAAYGTAKSGIGIAGVGTFRPDLIMKVRSFVCAVSRIPPNLLIDGDEDQDEEQGEEG